MNHTRQICGRMAEMGLYEGGLRFPGKMRTWLHLGRDFSFFATGHLHLHLERVLQAGDRKVGEGCVSVRS